MMEKEAEKYTNVRSMYRNRTNVEYTMCDDTSNHWKNMNSTKRFQRKILSYATTLIQLIHYKR